VAGDIGTKIFVLVSTDKAVSPATVMGASKALAEWAVESADRRDPSQPGTVETPVDGVAPVLVMGGRHQTPRLVEHQIAMCRRRHGHAIDHDACFVERNRMFGIANHTTGHTDAPLAHPTLGFAARAQPAFGQNARHAIARRRLRSAATARSVAARRTNGPLARAVIIDTSGTVGHSLGVAGVAAASTGALGSTRRPTL